RCAGAAMTHPDCDRRSGATENRAAPASSDTERYVGAGDPPARVRAHPGLALPADPVGAGRDVLGRGDADVTPEGDDALVAQGAALVDGAAAFSELGDRGVAIEPLRLTRAVAQRERAVPEERVERGDVVADEGALVGFERLRQLGDDFRDIDL